jgi:hypothetical protein
MPSSPPLQSYPDSAAADAEVTRQLNDEVLQSAEDAVLVEAAAPGGGVFPTATASASVAGRGPAPSSSKTSITQYVAANPCQSALLAAAVGALAAMLLRSRVRRHAGSRGWRLR